MAGVMATGLHVSNGQYTILGLPGQRHAHSLHYQGSGIRLITVIAQIYLHLT